MTRLQDNVSVVNVFKEDLVTNLFNYTTSPLYTNISTKLKMDTHPLDHLFDLVTIRLNSLVSLGEAMLSFPKFRYIRRT